MGGLGAPEIILIIIVVLILFGGKKIPELMKGLGKGVREFKDATNGDHSEPTSTTSSRPEEKTNV
ncbi:twin-arginine translocase TatA/TatE family subunit [Mucilaginibacter polytrichastri]|uniref:Sec-independent protein translocase protein TatA n=1 Tax=Mucilaginibacter polytrichastri TaxID=1302689 RepID=A0A1Q6A6A8_9SPHI|nr:twin-arginine translocase TatA/TatE family subunit [Mucilaginibacter polytrichastri]OKS89526.1 Sec-independent protein translocase protein TatA [Mucilaginibacter polytrichastri]SFS70861.1 sec-independent protein translocase protein TatA [Mucilaginibacter polytrichastri]